MRQCWVAAALLGLALVGCGGPSANTDSVATSVAQTVAALATPAPTVATIASTAAPTNLPAQPQTAVLSTLVPPTAEPPTLTPELPTPTDERVVAAVIPNGGVSEGLDGAVLAPGYEQLPAAFSETLALRVFVRDLEVGEADGAGIESVSFSLSRLEADGNSTFVYERTEASPAYCLASGDDPRCAPIQLAPGANWPNGVAISSGQYHIEVAIVATNPDKFAFWNFDFSVELP